MCFLSSRVTVRAGWLFGSCGNSMLNVIYVIYLSARYNILVLITKIVVIPTCSQHLLT